MNVAFLSIIMAKRISLKNETNLGKKRAAESSAALFVF